MTPGPQFQQLAMFATPHELAGNIGYSDQRWHDAQSTGQTLQQRKLAEAKAPERQQTNGLSLYEDIRKHGVGTPLEINHGVGGLPGQEHMPVLTEGHHRLFSALQTRPHDLIPLEHHDWQLKSRLENLSAFTPKRPVETRELGG